ncbi:MAG: LacI family DNA-binding transcriptional regulator [Gemmiger sp.]|nr:LacI family DNA-binding transcriptional regulator [Gemmiger sp.]
MTIYDIAKLAGVSASSVSRVINGKPGVNKGKREKIEELLRQHNYKPDLNARSLVMQANHTIAILIDNLVYPRHRGGISMVEDELTHRGYNCVVKYIPAGENTMEACMAELAGQHLEGIVCFGPSFRNHEKVRSAVSQHQPHTPVVLVNHMGGVGLDNVYSVGANEREGFTRCVELLASRGRKEIALLLDSDRVSASTIQEGFEQGIDKFQKVRGMVYTDIPLSLEGGVEAVRRILREHPRLDGLICANDLIAIGAMNELLDQGIRVPEQISIIGEENSLYCEICRPKLSSLDTMLNSLMLMAVRTLRDAIEGRETSHSITLSCDIVERGTT